jgi:hypothetical protein
MIWLFFSWIHVEATDKLCVYASDPKVEVLRRCGSPKIAYVGYILVQYYPSLVRSGVWLSKKTWCWASNVDIFNVMLGKPSHVPFNSHFLPDQRLPTPTVIRIGVNTATSHTYPIVVFL